MISLQSDLLYIEVNPVGAELSSVFSKKSRIEYLWQGGEEWRYRAPALFPIVGRLKNGAYTHKGKSYSMQIHGFLHDRPFDVIETTVDSVHFRTTSDAETLKIYPFGFVLDFIFTLKWNEIKIEYRVTNNGKTPLLYNIGAHEGFICPRHEGELFSDYWLDFGGQITQTALNASGLLLNKTGVLNGKFDFSDGAFVNESIVITSLPSNSVQLASKKSKERLEIRYYDAPNLVLWSPTKRFVCIEPWWGLPDYENASGELSQKSGIIVQFPGETREFLRSILIYE